MRVIELLRIASSYRKRLARTETMLAQSNKLLQDSKLPIQAQHRSDDHDAQGKEQAMKHEIQNSPNFTENCQLQEELQATIAESKDAVERSRWLIENSNQLLDKTRSA